ncbi:SRPBCC family protein [Lysobacter silvisoli]|uniref:SRPBCC domain-containing protein n=1 Tax=Lysobacter silvisoli TaxID=2293254 RepID=A0A371K5V2_9GAMM|nr:SRPBCC domain-containing protein [Lysobacter silvisoli]RDZ29323.1 SRPBCC domain-containing protein [Lysobacter silvisoli]
MSETPQQTVVDLRIAAPVETVWSALRDPAQILSWFGWDAPTLAEEIKFIFADHATGDEAHHRVQFGEWEGVSDAIELAAEAGGTRLRLMRSGAPPLDDSVYDDIDQGWVTFFQQLRLALERHRGQQRRTIFLSGPAKAGIGEPSIALGLEATSALPPGTAYTATLAGGETTSGEVWHRNRFQTGVTVDAWGPGLLVVTDKGHSPERPHGGGAALLTTYGLSDADFAALEARWKDWWSSRYPKPAE